MGQFIDLTGRKFGMLAVKCRGNDRYGKSGRRFITWDCVCDCGNEITVDGNNLRSGNTKSCGCVTSVKDITGQRFGKLIVLGAGSRCQNGEIKWKCVCDCGKETEVKGTSLRSGITKSCGCGMIEGLKVGWESGKHHETRTRLYSIWCGMKNRTSEKADERHKKDYYDRGIRICDEWKNSYESFRDWALANGYADDLTIDREDNDGDYCPENCRWVAAKEQANNRRSNRDYTFYGKTQNITQWARELKISEDMLRERLVVLGWSIEDALLTPSKRRGWSNEQRQLSRLCGVMRTR